MKKKELSNADIAPFVAQAEQGQPRAVNVPPLEGVVCPHCGAAKVYLVSFPVHEWLTVLGKDGKSHDTIFTYWHPRRCCFVCWSRL